MTKSLIEIMAPAGSFESLEAAIKAGADSVYFGVTKLNMRARASANFTITDMGKIVKRAKKANVLTYLVVNTLLFDHDMSTARKLVDSAKKYGVDAIVIDEVSMIRVDLMEGISAKLQIARRDDRPFGGCQMIMFGDLYQLPPVVADGQLHRYFNHNYGGVYFFNAPSVEKTDLQIYELGNIFRQKDPQFRNILNSIRNGDDSPEVLSKLNVRTGVEMPETGFVTLAGTNSTVSRINHKKLAALEGNEKTYEAEVTGDIKESAFPTERRLRLKVGAQIMMLKNDTMKPRRWVNGTLGVVVRLGIDSIRVNIDGVEHTVNRETWQKIRYEYNHEERKLMKIPVSEFTQLPVRLAWAMTIHKSQGQTYESVAVDMSDGAFAHGQTYVALSRCKSMEGLYLTTAIRREDIMVDDEIVEFMKKARIAG